MEKIRMSYQLILKQVYVQMIFEVYSKLDKSLFSTKRSYLLFCECREILTL